MTLDRAKAALTAFVKQLLSPYDFAAQYVYTIVSQNGDGSLELKSTVSQLPDLSKVPIWFGLPGTTAKLSGGTVLVSFRDMDPTKPFASLFSGTKISLITLPNGSKPVARLGDGIQGLWPPLMVAGTVITPTGPVPVPPTPMQITNAFSGTIDAGNLKVQM